MAITLKQRFFLALTLAVIPSLSFSQIDIKGVFFAKNSFALDADSRAILTMAANIMKGQHDLYIELRGSACPEEKDADQLWLDRALAVRSFMLKSGAPSSQIVTLKRISENEIPTTWGAIGPNCEPERMSVAISVDLNRAP